MNVCPIHGGRTPVGVASPHYQGKGQSRGHLPPLPERLLPRYIDSIRDPELLNRANSIAILDARLDDVLKRVDTGESGRLWTELMDSWLALQAKRTPENAVRHQQAIQRGTEDHAAWTEVMDLLKTRDKIAASESKRRIDMQATMDIREVMDSIRFLSEAVARNVRDEDERRAIAREFSRFLQARSGRGDENDRRDDEDG